MSWFDEISEYFMGPPTTPVPATPTSTAPLTGAGSTVAAGSSSAATANAGSINTVATGATTGTAPTAATAMAYAARQGSNHAPEATCATCGLQSVRFNLGWTFHPTDVPQGTVQLRPGMPQPQAIPANGEIVLDRASGMGIPQGTRRSVLEVAITNGPTYRFDVFFDLPAIQEPSGLKRRLTNMGLYAGIDEYFGGRALWAIRAFKRIHMNAYTRNGTVAEDDNVDGTNALSLDNAFMAAVQTAHGAHPDDVTAALSVPEGLINRQPTQIANAGMFLAQTLKRSSYETAGADDDTDAKPGSPGAVWGGVANPTVTASTPGYELCLGVYDEDAGEPPIANKVNLPQRVHMLQFALFETGYWGVAGGRANGQTITRFGPRATVGATNAVGGIFGSMDGGFGRSTHWALREFQCHAKMPRAAVEDVTVTEPLYLQRLITLPARDLAGPALYGAAEPVSGSANADTSRAIQDWLDRRYRCPVLIYAAPAAGYLTPASILSENIWQYDDYASRAPRMFAYDVSNYYTIPAAYSGNVVMGSATIPNPITVGEYTTSPFGNGPVSVQRHVWTGADGAEVTPQTMVGTGGLTGAGLTAAQESTFRVVRTVSHFECNGFLDSINAYDNSGISLGPCHWTLARTAGTNPAEPREMGALISYAAANHAAGYSEAIGRFGLSATSTWPLPIGGGTGTYNSTVSMATETGRVLLCGATPSLADNEYVKTWHFFYRMQMACRTVDGWQRAMWGFSRVRIEDIRNRTFTIGTRTIRIGDYATSEKTIAMLLRWHIISPAHVYGNSHVRTALSGVSAALTGQARENTVRAAILASYTANAPGWASAHAGTINGWTNVPQTGSYYQLNMTNPVLDGADGSLDFDAP